MMMVRINKTTFNVILLGFNKRKVIVIAETKERKKKRERIGIVSILLSIHLSNYVDDFVFDNLLLTRILFNSYRKLII